MHELPSWYILRQGTANLPSVFAQHLQRGWSESLCSMPQGDIFQSGGNCLWNLCCINIKLRRSSHTSISRC